MERLDLDIRDVVFGGNSFDRTLSAVFEINVPDALGCNAFKRRTGMFFSLAGRMQVGCSILAPKCANLAASSKFNCLTGAVSLTTVDRCCASHQYPSISVSLLLG